MHVFCPALSTRNMQYHVGRATMAAPPTPPTNWWETVATFFGGILVAVSPQWLRGRAALKLKRDTDDAALATERLKADETFATMLKGIVDEQVRDAREQVARIRQELDVAKTEISELKGRVQVATELREDAVTRTAELEAENIALTHERDKMALELHILQAAMHTPKGDRRKADVQKVVVENDSEHPVPVVRPIDEKDGE